MTSSKEIYKKVSSVISGVNCYPFLFIGSGLSRRYMGTRNWEGLLNWVCQEVFNDEFAYARLYSAAKTACSRDAKKALMPYFATLLEDSANEALLSEERFTWFRERFSHELKTGSSPLKCFIANDLAAAEVHPCEESNLIVDKCGEKISGVLTTNYDYLIESLFPKCDVFVGENDLLFKEMSFSAEAYKIHGSAASPNTMILTQADYDEFEKKQAYLAAKILTIFMEYPIIFLGYSLQDPNISSILASIAQCVGTEHLSTLSNRFIFVEYGDDEENQIRVMSRTFGSETISMTYVVTKDFMPIFQAIAEAKTMYDPVVARRLRKSIYTIASHLDPQKSIVTSGFSQLDKLKDEDKIILGFGSLQEGYGKMPSADEFYMDALFDDLGLNEDLVVSEYLPKLLKSNSGGLPMYKYLSISDVLDFDNRLIEQIKKRTSVESFLHQQQKASKNVLRKSMDTFSVESLVEVFGFDEAHKKLYVLVEDEINPDTLEKHLRTLVLRKGGIEFMKNNSELKRAIRIFDYIKYGPKTQKSSPTCGQSANTRRAVEEPI